MPDFLIHDYPDGSASSVPYVPPVYGLQALSYQDDNYPGSYIEPDITDQRWTDPRRGNDLNDGILVEHGGTGPWQTFTKGYEEFSNSTTWYCLNVRGLNPYCDGLSKDQTKYFGVGPGVSDRFGVIRGCPVFGGGLLTGSTVGVQPCGQQHVLWHGFSVLGERGIRIQPDFDTKYHTYRGVVGELTDGHENTGVLSFDGVSTVDYIGVFDCLLKGSNGIGGDTQGVYMSRVGNYRVENNVLSHCESGFYYKHSDDAVDYLGESYVRFNYMHSTYGSCVRGAFQTTIIEHNILDGDMRFENGGGLHAPRENTIRKNTITGSIQLDDGDGVSEINGFYIRNNIVGKEIRIDRYGSAAYTSTTLSDWNLVGSGFVVHGVAYTVAEWQAGSVPVGQDQNSIAGLPAFINGANPLVIEEFVLASGSLGAFAADDGENMGADVSLVGRKLGFNLTNIIDRLIYHLYPDLSTWGAPSQDLVETWYHVDKDHPSASDSNDGSLASPWATVQKATQTLGPGEGVYIHESGVPYDETDSGLGLLPVTTAKGLKMANAGHHDAPIWYRAYPGDQPVIDFNDEGAWYFRETQYVVWEGIRLTKGNFLSMSSESWDNWNVTIDGCEVDDHYGTQGSNIAGLRLDRVERAVVRNSVVHDIYATDDGTRAGAGASSGSDGHAFESYYSRKILIENNTFYNAAKGVYSKVPWPSHSENTGFIVRRNKFYDLRGQAVDYAGNVTVATSGHKHTAQLFVENLTYNCAALLDTTNDHTVDPFPDGLYWINNTHIGTRLHFKGFNNVRFFNNIIDNLNTDSGQQSVMTYYNAPGSQPSPTLVEWDHNCWLNRLDVRLNAGGVIPDIQYADGSAWRGAVSSETLVLKRAVGPDLNSLFQTDPMFVDAANDDYALMPGSPCLGVGRGSVAMGAPVALVGAL